MFAVFIITSEVRSRSGVAKRVLIPEIASLRICFVMCVFLCLLTGAELVSYYLTVKVHITSYVFFRDIYYYFFLLFSINV